MSDVLFLFFDFFSRHHNEPRYFFLKWLVFGLVMTWSQTNFWQPIEQAGG